MVSRDARQFVVWPHYFDKALSRAQGRRVPADLAVEGPHWGDLAKAARSLGLKVTQEENARAPGHWGAGRGRILVARTEGGPSRKEDLLQQIARRL